MATLAACAPALADSSCSGDFTAPGATPPSSAGAAPLRFGIYPGGTAGQVGLPAAAKPDQPDRILSALAQLRAPGRPFTVHIYRDWTGDAQAERAGDAATRALIDRYAPAGYQVEQVIRYRPADPNGDPAGFAAAVRAYVARFGSEPALHSLQVTNEANSTLSSDASDGTYPGAVDALVQGVEAAKDQARRSGGGGLSVGFNWFYRMDPGSEDSFWSAVGAKGGRAFVSALDWVGVDAYPGTFFPPSQSPELADGSLVNAFSVLRECYLPEAGIPATTPLHVSENGYPTGPNRSEADQATALQAMVQASSDYRKKWNVTDYFWFDLRDSDSGSPNFQSQYGLMHDDYSPKPAFGLYRDLVHRLAGPPVSGAPAGGPAPGAGSACDGPAAPVSRVTGHLRARHRRLRLRGVARAGCGGTVVSVRVAVGRRAGARCRWLTPRGRLGRAVPCTRPAYLRARVDRRGRWSLAGRGPLRPGRYLVRIRAVDATGHVERRARARRLRVR